ncbi:phosphatidylserine decarboxylase [Aureibaculum marinum]|uniref:Phosphatidylserine decarboxylase n=1 Tax=Aureibaculum marinum TaxID=2487930 RepID=A0A3N4NTR8_9FLAO|nr:acyl-CoA-binding protein [Aureibaculum marinum]RPD99544.1 phosphatidylserine decarboxylase [Aureibaculum marinum]
MSKLDDKFKIAFEIASNMTQRVPPDIMLKFYAYYKQATKGEKYKQPERGIPLRNAFKLNAWLQIKNLSTEEAKEKYIALVEEITNKKIE